jgi:hypothetical protein
MAAGLFDNFFDNDYRQREDIDTLRLDAQLDTENIGRLTYKLHATAARLDRTELVLEAMFLYLENQGLMNRETLARLVQEVDELDGKRDGRAGVKPTDG